MLVGEPWQPAWWTDERRAHLASAIGLARFPSVRQSPFAPFPMVVGCLRPTIVLPASAPESWTSSQWEAVLLHEAAHVARRDPLSALVQSAAVTLYWWWPVAHLLSRRIHDLRETICDDFALEGACDPVAYADLLMQTAERLVGLRTLPAAVGLLDSAHGGLKERITRLLSKENRSMTRLSLAGKLLGPAALLLLCLTITATSAYSQAPPPQRNVQIKIVIDGKELDLNDEVIQALLARQKSAAENKPFQPNSSQLILDLDRQMRIETKFTELAVEGLAEGAVVNDPRIDQLVRQAEAIKAGAGEAVRKLLTKKQSGDFWKVLTLKYKEPAEIEELAKRAEALAPGSGEKIRKLLSGDRHFYAQTGGSSSIPPPVPTVNMDAVRLIYLNELYDLAQKKPFAILTTVAPTGAAPMGIASTVNGSTGTASMGTASTGAASDPSKDRTTAAIAVEQLAQKSRELQALAQQVERLNGETRALRQQIDEVTKRRQQAEIMNGFPRPKQQQNGPTSPPPGPQSK